MKVIEIINEGFWTALAKGVGKTALPIEKTKSIKDVTPTASSQYSAMKAAAQANKGLLKVPFFGKALYRSKIKDAGKKYQLAKTTVAATYVNNLGAHISNMLVLLNIYDAVTDYYAAASVVEQSELSQEEKTKQLDTLRGILVVQVIGGGLIAKSAQLGRIFTGILPAMAKLVPGTIIPKIGIAAREVINAAIRVGAGTLTVQLTTDEGIKALTDWLGETIVNGFGQGMTFFIDFLIPWLWAAIKWSAGYRASEQPPSTTGQQTTTGQKTTGPNTQPTTGTSNDKSGMGDIASVLSQGGDFNTIAAKLAAKQLGLD